MAKSGQSKAKASGLIRSRIVGHGDVKPEELLANPLNFRRHPGHQMDALRGSLKELGWLKTILVNKTTGHVLDGHARVEEAMRQHMPTVPVTIVELTPEEERLALAVLDPITELATRDAAVLDDLLAQVEAQDAGLQALLDQMAGKDGAEHPASGLKDGVDPDAVPDPPKVPVTQPGDLYILGNHRLLCGDSTNRAHVERLMDGAKAGMVFTDPPYNIDYGNIKHPKFKQRAIQNDNMDRGDFRAFCQGFAGCIKEFCDGIIYVFGPPGADGRVMFTVLDETFHCSTTIIWNKDQFTLGRGKYQNKYEPCWFGWSGSGATFTEDRTLTNVWDFPRPKSSDLHPTMKPVGLVEIALEHASKPGHTVLDLFGGSGTTMIACESTGRHARVMELDPIYCDVIVKRWEDATGRKAERKAAHE